jgi:hypothetical protein
MRAGRPILSVVGFFVFACVSASAQQVSGVSGSSRATTTVLGNQLPPPDPEFGGVIKEKATESTPWWPPRVVPPKGAPNVLLIMTDDVGFGAPGTFGGLIPTPAMDRIAKAGLRYTNFHSTALCSPTRAAIITGRNHHSVGFGVVGEIATGFPGYDSIIPIEKGSIGTILKSNGYATAWFGKDHNTPFYQASQAGPFDQWPNGMGFEYFYGFVGGTPPDVITGYNWELYNVSEDPTEYDDLAAKMPDKLKQMQDLFYSEAKKYNVLPLDNSTLGRWNMPRPSLTAGRTLFTYSGELIGTPASAAPTILDKGYTITAEVDIPEGGAEGMIVTQGGRFGGYGLFLSKGEFGFDRGKVVFLYNLLDLKRTMWEGPELEAGRHTIVFDLKPDGPELGKGGTGVLSVDGKEVARKTLEHTTPIGFPEDESFDIGQDTRTGVALVEYRYDPPFKFTGKINKLIFKLESDKPEARSKN